MLIGKAGLRIAKLALLGSSLSTAAFAMPAPDGMVVSKILEGAKISGFPSAKIDVDYTKPFPESFEFHYSGGQKIDAQKALDGHINPKDPRLSPGNMTCSFTLHRNSIPDVADLTAVPAAGARRVTFASGRVIVLQKVAIPFDTSDEHTTVSNELVCYKVGPAPITVKDLKRALGAKQPPQQLGIELSPEQSLRMAAQQSMREHLGRAKGDTPAPPKLEEGKSSPKDVPSPTPPTAADPGDEVVDDSTEGKYSTRTPAK